MTIILTWFCAHAVHNIVFIQKFAPIDILLQTGRNDRFLSYSWPCHNITQMNQTHKRNNAYPRQPPGEKYPI